MSEQQYDLIVIGAGPGGYVCAFRASQLGLRVALVEKRPTLGGTCLNVGCIPSKALLHSTEIFHAVQSHGSRHGIKVQNLEPDLENLMEAKDKTVKKLVGGIAQLCKSRKITVIQGTGTLAGNNRVRVASDGEEPREFTADHIVISTGSVSVELPFLRFDGEVVVGSDEAVAFDAVPNRLAVVGAGAIGLELGSVWSRLGSEVTIIEALDQVAPTFDPDIGKQAERIFKRQGMRLVLSAKVTGLKRSGKKRLLQYDAEGKEQSLEVDKVLVAVGRRPFLDGLGLDEAGVECDDKKRVQVDDQLRTSIPGIWAIGDAVAGPMLAHKAEEEGVAVAERIAGKPAHVNYDVIPNVIYTTPEIASAGLTERDAKERKIAYKVGKFPLAANGRALAAGTAEGMVKVLAEQETDRLLGVQILAPSASEIIAAVVAHLEYGGSAEDLGRTVHAHPTISEALKEAALAVHGSALHAL